MRPCNSCPFRKNTDNYGNSDWLLDVLKGFKAKSLTHSCHRTDPRADGYVGHKDGKESICMGYIAMIKKELNECYDPRISLALVKGDLDWDTVETSEVFDSREEFIKHHVHAILEASK